MIFIVFEKKVVTRSKTQQPTMSLLSIYRLPQHVEANYIERKSIQTKFQQIVLHYTLIQNNKINKVSICSSIVWTSMF